MATRSQQIGSKKENDDRKEGEIHQRVARILIQNLVSMSVGITVI